MHNCIIGSLVSSTYLGAKVGGYNLPLITNLTGLTDGIVLFDIATKIKRCKLVDHAYVIKILGGFQAEMRRPLNCSNGLSDSQLAMLYLSLLANKNHELAEKLKKDISKDLHSILSLYSRISKLESPFSPPELALEYVSTIDYEDYKTLKERSPAFYALHLGAKAGLESDSFSDALRRCLYAGLSEELSFFSASFISNKRQFLPSNELINAYNTFSEKYPLLN